MHHLPKTRFAPTLIAPETFVIHDHHGEGTAPVCVALNSMVIRSAEPVVVDTGMAENREQFLADVFSLVEPEDIRWVFISHDDVDHTGNLNALMEAAPNAVAVVNWFMVERMGASLAVGPDRQEWLAGINTFDRYVSPWLELVDGPRFQATVDRIAGLRPTTIVGCHTPVISSTRVAAALAATRRSPRTEVPAQPDQSILDVIQAAPASMAA